MSNTPILVRVVNHNLNRIWQMFKLPQPCPLTTTCPTFITRQTCTCSFSTGRRTCSKLCALHTLAWVRSVLFLTPGPSPPRQAGAGHSVGKHTGPPIQAVRGVVQTRILEKAISTKIKVSMSLRTEIPRGVFVLTSPTHVALCTLTQEPTMLI